MVAGWSRDWTVNGHAPQAGSLRIYGRILRGICATAGVFSSSLTALVLNVPIGRFYASINAPYAHLIHKISFYWTKKTPERLHMCNFCCNFVADFGLYI